MSRLATAEDMNIWVSTTMIQALRELVDLYTHFFELLARTLGGLLDLLSACICLSERGLFSYDHCRLTITQKTTPFQE
jgi:Sec7-like guanine-nucleotide exchange factor